jgi:hypothetical protein
VKAIIPGYILDTGVGKRIAALKGLDTGWYYPTYLIQYLRNPGPLFLFDEIIIDEESADRAIEILSSDGSTQKHYENICSNKMRATDDEIEALRSLIDSEIFGKVDVADMLKKRILSSLNTNTIWI